MAINGDVSPLWDKRFPRDQIPNIIQLVLDSWKTFKVGSERLEVPITRRFCAHLRNNKKRSIHFFRIEWESTILDNKAKETGRIDMKFSQGWDEKVYFSIECKRLRVDLPSGFKTLSDEYVVKGMFRYFNGQYAEDLDKGGMLGYVMDGNIDKALQDVQKAIESRRTDLYMNSNNTLRSCSCLSSEQVKETFHNYGPDNCFIIYHIFLPISTSLNSDQFHLNL